MCDEVLVQREFVCAREFIAYEVGSGCLAEAKFSVFVCLACVVCVYDSMAPAPTNFGSPILPIFAPLEEVKAPKCGRKLWPSVPLSPTAQVHMAQLKSELQE